LAVQDSAWAEVWGEVWAQSQTGVHSQAGPQAQPAQLQVGAQVQGLQVHWSVMGTSLVSGLSMTDRYVSPVRRT